ncbi:unnamed protein product [Adineta steineri]|uniref:Uncharacterized protein n=1 Tax=Adineta steineri TaxID=433720 RepID=A0A819HGT9_9BILA|nr:unnamed protein product [Adineta steineri]CAF3899763.1 unnamed protein product [Adineta steineri]
MSSNTTKTDENNDQIDTNDRQSELANLAADADIPLDELLKLYKKNAATIDNDRTEDEESYTSSDIDDDDDDNDDDRNDRRQHLLHVNGDLLLEGDDDTEDSLYEPDIVKLINVGDEYQAQFELKPEFDSSNEHCDEREVPIDEVLWSSTYANDVDNENIDEYLKKIHTEYPSSDDEISLRTLYNCQLNTDLALVKFRQLSIKTIYFYPAWSFEEIRQFEDGLREYGKNFFKISIFKCPNRSVRELVYFYYQWKKSERYDLFIEEQQRINSLNSVSDIIEKFIEEQEQQLCTATGVVDPTNSSSFLLNDFKLHTPLSSNSSISFVTIHQQETTTTTTKRSYDEVDNDHNESSSSKKTSLNTQTSSAEATATIV